MANLSTKLKKCLFFGIPCTFPENRQDKNLTKEARFTEENINKSNF